eukprot:g10052.t1
MAMVLYPLHRKYTLKRVVCSTYQAASGAGKEGMDELVEGMRDLVECQNGKTNGRCVGGDRAAKCNVFPHMKRARDESERW